ncbi:hypothetical protein BUALT_Bualt11G0072400 [Buddleja alternifolia]|uniref:Uncharacterized protein n=1 Tax=Buddleja alternifolia TaxID=168488 RepID=A0AAV6X0G6_9LAMI|nr:hypothetical protein BUALT_Bualt11G0072400 [Buddleja alternifolia]
MWKGGKLKLEKAKEDYICRLRREWTEDAELAIKLSKQNTDADESMHTLQKPKKDQDIEKMQVRIFFPKLRKIKPLPLKGSGKHKYSFQRVEIPPLPIHFCDCEEHSGPPEPVKNNYTDHNETETCGVNEEELNMMKSILNKLLEEEDYPMTGSNENEFTEETNHNVNSIDNWQVDDNEEDQMSDEDNLVINIVGQPSNRVASFEDWGQKTAARNQDSLLREQESHETQGNKKLKLLLDKKRKHPIDTDNSVPSKRKAIKGNPHDSVVNPVVLDAQPTDTDSASVQLSRDVASSQKTAWKNLVRKKGATDFHISDILTDLNPDVKLQLSSDHLAAPKIDSQDDQSSEDEEFEKIDHLAEPEKNSQDDQSSEDEELEKIDHLAGPEKDSQGDQSSEDEELEKIDHLSEPKKDSQDEQSSEDEELEIDHLSEPEDEEVEKISDGQPTKSIEDKSGRGAAWLQKSSWLQLVGDANSSAFNLGQILPGVTFEKQELQQFDNNNLSNSKVGKQQRIVHKDKKSPVWAIRKAEGKGDEDIYACPRDPNVNASTKEQGHTGQSNFDLKQTVEENGEASAPVPESNLVANKRASIGDVVVSETCPFMRTAASMKEWAKTKAALCGSLKKKGGKE